MAKLIKGRVAALGVGAAVGAAAVVDAFTGSNVASSVKEFYSAHPVAAGVATVAGLDAIACLVSKKVREANLFALGFAIYGPLLLIDGVRGSVLSHPRRWVAGAAAAAITAAIVVGAGKCNSDRNYSSPAAVRTPQVAVITTPVPVPGPQGLQGLVGPQGIQGPAGRDYVLTETDKASIAQKVVDEYLKITPTPVQATPVPATKTPAPAATLTPTKAPAATATPAPYALPSGTFEVNYASIKSIVGRDAEQFSRASGVGKATLQDLVDGNTARITRTDSTGKVIETYNPELVKVIVDPVKKTVAFEFKGGERVLPPNYRSDYLASLKTYLSTQTTPQERAGIVPIVAK